MLVIGIQGSVAGIITGRVFGEAGAALPFATVLVSETGYGTTTNAEGIYELSLVPGQYTLLFQYMGYKSRQINTEISDEILDLDIRLEPQSYILPNLTYRSGKEDPAYGIMRKVIAKSKYHLYQFEKYSTRVYMKGSGRVKKVPGLLRKRLEKEGLDTSRVFMVESVTDLEFELPNVYRENVISIRSTMEEETPSPMTYIKDSFYQEKIADALSPLSPTSFAHYRFRYEGYFVDNNYTVFKIAVSPRIKGDRVFEGYLYIIEDLWAIHSIDFKTRFQGFRVHIDQLFAPVLPAAWLPVSTKFDVDGSIMGFDLEFNYVAINNDYEVSLNSNLDHIDAGQDDNSLKSRSEVKTNKEESIPFSEEGELSKKEMRKLMKEYEKEALVAHEMDEDKDVIINETLEIDSMAHRHDSAYWRNIRPIPLTPGELMGYQQRDSLIAIQKTKEAEDSIKNEKNKTFRPGHIITGNSYAISGSTTLTWRSIWDKISYNTVEGFNINGGFDLQFKLDSIRRLKIGPTVRYGFSSKRVNYKLDAEYTFERNLKSGELSFSAGRYISQINSDDPIPYWLNMLSSLFFRENFMKLLEEDFLKANISFPIFPKLTAHFGLNYSVKRSLENSSEFSIISSNKEYSPNNPSNILLQDTQFSSYRLLGTRLNLEYVPFQRYQVRNGKKYVDQGHSPIINLIYQNGLFMDESSSNYHYLGAGFRYGHSFGVGNRYDLSLGFGGFIEKQDLPFPEFVHFTGNRTPFLTNDLIETFRMLDYYYYSIDSYQLNAHAIYQFRQLLITQILYTRYMGWREDLFVNYLYSNSVSNYYEIGYALDNLFNFLRFEVVGNFIGSNYEGLAFRIGFSKFISME
jgi:hypothetical protein